MSSINRIMKWKKLLLFGTIVLSAVGLLFVVKWLPSISSIPKSTFDNETLQINEIINAERQRVAAELKSFGIKLSSRKPPQSSELIEERKRKLFRAAAYANVK